MSKPILRGYDELRYVYRTTVATPPRQYDLNGHRMAQELLLTVKEIDHGYELHVDFNIGAPLEGDNYPELTVVALTFLSAVNLNRLQEFTEIIEEAIGSLITSTTYYNNLRLAWNEETITGYQHAKPGVFPRLIDPPIVLPEWRVILLMSYLALTLHNGVGAIDPSGHIPGFTKDAFMRKIHRLRELHSLERNVGDVDWRNRHINS